MDSPNAIGSKESTDEWNDDVMRERMRVLNEKRTNVSGGLIFTVFVAI